MAWGGDYVMLAKGNQPTLEQDIATVFTTPPPLRSSASTPAPRTRGTDGWSGVN